MRCMSWAITWTGSCRGSCMVSPYGCFGTPHQACVDANIPVIVVRKNRSCLSHPDHPKFIHVENYGDNRHPAWTLTP